MTRTLMTVSFDADTLIRDIMKSQPEHSVGMALQCYTFDYKKMLFWFRDTEAVPETAEPSITKMKVVKLLKLRRGDETNVVTYKLGIKELRSGMKLMAQAIFDGELPGIEFDGGFTDAGNWDSVASDMLIQYSIFGKTIYG